MVNTSGSTAPGGCTYWAQATTNPVTNSGTNVTLGNVNSIWLRWMFDVARLVGAFGYEPARGNISWCQLLPDSAVDLAFLVSCCAPKSA
jgi:hypothetical protein